MNGLCVGREGKNLLHSMYFSYMCTHPLFFQLSFLSYFPVKIIVLIMLMQRQQLEDLLVLHEIKLSVFFYLSY